MPDYNESISSPTLWSFSWASFVVFICSDCIIWSTDSVTSLTTVIGTTYTLAYCKKIYSNSIKVNMANTQFLINTALQKHFQACFEHF